ncbi:hypothetical protein DIPPA_13304 [Diplonema papillatum]|nr:hypothetical protein DIPPA_13304 [Diplonema papillatum]
MPENDVGDSANSWSYQSTGHMLHAGEVLEAHLAPSFTMGDYIGVLLDKKQRYIAFYKNGRMAGVPFVDIDTTLPFRLVISCYTGPCSISVNLSPLATNQIQSIMTFPIYIDQDAQQSPSGRS